MSGAGMNETLGHTNDDHCALCYGPCGGEDDPPTFRVSDQTVETAAEALFEIEYPKYSPDAVADSNRWSWRGVNGDGNSDHGPKMKQAFRDQARVAVEAALPSLPAEIEQRVREQIASEIEAMPVDRINGNWDYAPNVRSNAARIARGGVL